MKPSSKPRWTWRGAPHLPVAEREALRARIVEADGSSGAHECCGLLIGSVDSEGVVRVVDWTFASNVARHPTDSFLVEADHLMRAERQAREANLALVGAWHTHPSGSTEPSAQDRRGLPEGWLGWVLTVTDQGLHIRAYRREELPRSG